MTKRTIVHRSTYARLDRHTRERKFVGATAPEMTVCRRVEDFPLGVAPVDAQIARCVRCQARVAYDPSAPHQEAPKVCWECVDMTPQPAEAKR